jgi:hypothetical protein
MQIALELDDAIVDTLKTAEQVGRLSVDDPKTAIGIIPRTG